MRLAAGHDFVEFSISTESPVPLTVVTRHSIGEKAFAMQAVRWAQTRRLGYRFACRPPRDVGLREVLNPVLLFSPREWRTRQPALAQPGKRRISYV